MKGGWRAGCLLVVLVLVEGALVRAVGPVAGQVRVLGGLGDPSADPVGGLLAVLAAAAELLTAYLLLVVGVRLAALLPGAPGLLAARGAHVVALPVLRRALDGLLGGVLLAQVVLSPAVVRAQPASPDPPPAVAASALVGGAALAAGAGSRPPLEDLGRAAEPWAGVPTTTPSLPPPVPVPTTTPSLPPPVPVPTWLGGGGGASGGGPTAPPTSLVPGGSGRSSPGGRGPDAAGRSGAAGARVGRAYVVRPGGTLWGIAAAHLPAGDRSVARVDRYWRRIYAANRGVLGDDPDLIRPGARLVLPPAGPPLPRRPRS